jgi:hypothetical protein
VLFFTADWTGQDADACITIEATMSTGLVLAGGTSAAVIAAVLLYRVISGWALVPLGWGLWCTMPNAHLARSNQRRDPPDPVTDSFLAV